MTWQRSRAPIPDVGTGRGKRPGGTYRARGASTVEETLLRHVIPCFQAVSICNLDVSLQFVLDTVVF